MEVLLNLFALIQAAGAIIGAGGAVASELSYLRAIHDGRIDSAERAHLRILARALRSGMILVLVGSIGLVLGDYYAAVPLQPGLSTSYWAEMLLAVIVIWASWALARGRIPFWLGSAATFSGWWFLAYLCLGRLPLSSIGAVLGAYIVITGIFAGALAYARMLTRPHE